MTSRYDSLKKILSTINDQQDLNKDNIIQKIQEELEKQDQNLYKEWDNNKFEVNYIFTSSYSNCSVHTLSRVAAWVGYTNVLDSLIASGANISDKSKNGWTPVLNLAAEHGHVETVKALLEIEGIKVSERDSDGWTPLNHAACNGHTETVVVLLEAGANVDEKNRNGTGWTALHLAACSGHIKTVTTLLEGGAKVDEKNENGYTALHFAASHNHTEMIKVLLKAGANPSLKNESGETPRDLAEDYDLKGFLKKAENKQLMPAIKNGVIFGSSTALLGTAIAVALFATGTVTVELIPIVIAVVAVTAAALVVGGAIYVISGPSTEMNKVKEEQGLVSEWKVRS